MFEALFNDIGECKADDSPSVAPDSLPYIAAPPQACVKVDLAHMTVYALAIAR